MFFILRICSIALLLAGVSTPLKADTSVEQATACFETMMAAAKGGASFSTMVENYIVFTVLAARAVHFQKGLRWNELDPATQAGYLNAIKTYFDKEADKVQRGIRPQDYVNLETVELRPKNHKKVSPGFQLSGTYKTMGGNSESFALYVVKSKGRCYVHDARWRDAWLSKYVPLP